MKNWSNLASIVFRRTYARKDNNNLETFNDAVERIIEGNVRNHNVSSEEINRLKYFIKNRKAGPAGRGWWFSGSPNHATLGGAALTNCWAFVCDDWMKFIVSMDLLMLGGGIGLSVEHKYVSKLPKVKKGVSVHHKSSKDAFFIVPDSREGWCELVRRVLKSFFYDGKSFEYSTVCIRGAGEAIKGFGGTSSGPIPLINLVEKLCKILSAREGKHVRPIDCVDIICSIAEMVVSGNVRRSAVLVLGDAFDKEYLKAKRWDLGILPAHRSCANFSVVCDDIQDLHPLFWESYKNGEPFGIVNRTNIQKYGRMGELKKDTAELVNPCVPAGTEILTKDGYKQIEQTVNQETEIWNGFEWSMVIPKITGYNQPLLKITMNDGRELTCTTKHKFLISEGYRGKHQRLEASELKIGDKLVKCDYPIINEGEDVDHAYLQGFVSAEGMDNYNYFYVYPPKKACMRRFLSFIDIRNSNEERIACNLRIDLKEKKFVPFSWNLSSKINWLSGLIDGDGFVSKDGNIQISSVNLEFLKNTQKMLTTMGVNSKVRLSHKSRTKFMSDGKGGKKEYFCKNCYRLLIACRQVQTLIDLGLECERVNLSFNKSVSKSQYTRIIEIKAAGVADTVYCFNEPKKHLGMFNGVLTCNCGEATLEDGEGCNLQDIVLPNINSVNEFEEAARLMHRWGKRVACENYHIEHCNEVIKRNFRIGTSLTGCLKSPLFVPETLDKVYKALQDENVKYSKQLKIPESIRLTTMKPSGTTSKMYDMGGYEGLHVPISRYSIQRVRFSANDNLIPLLKNAGHHIEPVIKLDGTLDRGTVVVDFYVKAPDGYPVADENWTTWNQLDVLKMAQEHWSDQAVSVTVYYDRNEIEKVKEWLGNNLKYLKGISFLCQNEHGFKQAPKEAITKEQYEKLSESIKPINVKDIQEGGDLEGTECAGGACPLK